MAKAMTHEAEYTKTVAFGQTSAFKVELRELANHWVDKHSTKFSKINGFQIGEKYNPKILNLKSIKELKCRID